MRFFLSFFLSKKKIIITANQRALKDRLSSAYHLSLLCFSFFLLLLQLLIMAFVPLNAVYILYRVRNVL